MTEPDDDWVLVGTSGIEKLSDEEEKRLQEWKQSRDIWNARIADGSATTYGQAYTEEPYTEEPVPVPEPEPGRTLPIEGTLHPSRGN